MAGPQQDEKMVASEGLQGQVYDKRTRPLEGKQAVMGTWKEAKYHRVGDQMHVYREQDDGRTVREVLTIREWATQTADARDSTEIVHPQHYNRGKIEVWDFIHDQRLGFFEGNVIKYVARASAKGGLKDLRKAREYIDKLIRLEEDGEGLKARAPDGGPGR